VIKFVFRWAFRLLLLALVLVIGLLLLKDNIARSLAEHRIRSETGFDAKIGTLQFSLFTPTVTIENLVLYNPLEFGGSTFLDAPHLHVEYRREGLPFGRLHLKFLRADLRELHIVENGGRTNIVDFLHSVSPRLPVNKEGEHKKADSFTGIDLLNLSVGKIRYTNLPRPKRNQEINVSLENLIVPNIRSEEDFTNILWRILFRSGISIYLDQKKLSQGHDRTKGTQIMPAPRP